MGDCFNEKHSNRAAQEQSLSTALRGGPPRTWTVLSHLVAALATGVRDFWPSLPFPGARWTVSLYSSPVTKMPSERRHWS